MDLATKMNWANLGLLSCKLQIYEAVLEGFNIQPTVHYYTHGIKIFIFLL